MWVEIPEDASSIVVREYIADRANETIADFVIEPLDAPGIPPIPTDTFISEQLTSMAWTIAKLMTLHRTVKPELLETPNVLVTAEAAQLGSADTTPDNLYMIGTFRLAPDEAFVLEFEPPETRYWTVTLENIWHECIDPHRRRSSITNAAAVADADGKVRIVVVRDGSGRRQLARHRRPSPRLADHPLARPPGGAGGEDAGRAGCRGRTLTRFGRARADRYTAFLFAAGWSSLVARRAHNPKVGGSNPPPATIVMCRDIGDVCVRSS